MTLPDFIEDSDLRHWHTKIFERNEEHPPSITIEGNLITVVAHNMYFACEIVEDFPHESPYKLEILVGKEVYYSSPRKNKTYKSSKT